MSGSAINSNVPVGFRDRSSYPLGPVFADDFVRANGTPGSNYDTVTTSGTINITSNKLHMVGPGSLFGNKVTYNQLTSGVRDACFGVDLTINSATSSTTIGPFLELTSQAGLNPVTVGVVINTTNTTNNGLVDVYRNGTRWKIQTTTERDALMTSGSFAIANGNRLIITWQLTEFGGEVLVRNVSADTINKFSFDFGINKAVTTANCFRYSVGSVGGTQDASNFFISYNALKNADFCWVGNSIIQGYSASRAANSWIQRLMKASRKSHALTYAQSGRTAEFLLMLPELLLLNADCYVLCELMGNDKANGVADATWQANYATIVTALKAAGKQVKHVSPIPRDATDMSGVLTYLQSTYSSDQIIDVYTPMKAASGTALNSIYSVGDGTHLSDYGHAKEGVVVAASTNDFYR